MSVGDLKMIMVSESKLLVIVDADLLGGPGLFEDMPMDPPDVSNIEPQPLADDTITDMPPPPGNKNTSTDQIRL